MIRNGLKIIYLIWNQVGKHGRRPAEWRRCRNRRGSWLEIYRKIEDFVRCYDSRHEKSEKFLLFISPSSSSSEIRRNWSIFFVAMATVEKHHNSLFFHYSNRFLRWNSWKLVEKDQYSSIKSLGECLIEVPYTSLTKVYYISQLQRMSSRECEIHRKL
jgi:hypothetical protein